MDFDASIAELTLEVERGPVKGHFTSFQTLADSPDCMEVPRSCNW